MEKELKKQFYLSLVIKSLIILFGITGIFATIYQGQFMISFKSFLYYTIQSNLLVIFITAVFLYFHYLEYIKGRIVINNNWLLAKFAIAVAITITFLVFFTLLAPTLPASYLLSFDNFSVHLIVPVLAIIDFFIFDYKIEFGKLKQLIALAMPLYYLIFVLTLSAFSVDFNGEIVPYFFLNYEKNGWLWEKNEMGVIFWIIILSLCMVMLAYLFSFAIKSRKKQREKKNK